MEVLISLLYGECVRVCASLLRTLSQHAQLLGLSHHICSTLQTPHAHAHAHAHAHNPNTGRKKQTRKPVLKKNTEKKSENVESNFFRVDQTEGEREMLDLSLLCGEVEQWPLEEQTHTQTQTHTNAHALQTNVHTPGEGGEGGEVLGVVITSLGGEEEGVKHTHTRTHTQTHAHTPASIGGEGEVFSSLSTWKRTRKELKEDCLIFFCN